MTAVTLYALIRAVPRRPPSERSITREYHPISVP